MSHSAPGHRRSLTGADVLGTALAVAAGLLIFGCWTSWAAPIARVQEGWGGSSVLGRTAAGWLPTGLLSWSAAVLIVAHARSSPRLRLALQGVVLALAAASLATVPVLVSYRAGKTTAVEVGAYLDTLGRSGEAFQTGERPRQAIDSRWRALLAAYLVLAPVVVLVLVGWLCGD